MKKPESEQLDGYATPEIQAMASLRGAKDSPMTLVTQNPPTKDDLLEIVKRMHAVAEETYWCFFRAGMGAHCHAFLEFNGVLSKYVQICGQAAEQGIDFTQANVHSNKPLPVAAHDVEYLAEKLGCILGPLINANPEARKAFARAFFGSSTTHSKAHAQEEGTES